MMVHTHADRLQVWWGLARGEAWQLFSLPDVFLTAAPLGHLFLCVSRDSALSEIITAKCQQTPAVASEEMLK